MIHGANFVIAAQIQNKWTQYDSKPACTHMLIAENVPSLSTALGFKVPHGRRPDHTDQIQGRTVNLGRSNLLKGARLVY